MTKKDYDLIADTLKFNRPSLVAKPKDYEVRFVLWADIVNDLAKSLRESPAFKIDKFIKKIYGK